MMKENYLWNGSYTVVGRLLVSAKCECLDVREKNAFKLAGSFRELEKSESGGV